MSVATARDGGAILRAVLDDPDDDFPRLLYADWCDEGGQIARAEFVRIQCRVAELGVASGHPKTTPLAWSCKCAVCEEAKPLRRRVRDLLLHSPRPGITTYAWRDWGGVAVGVVPQGARFDDHLTFRRGFVEAVRCDLASWLAHGPAVALAHPVTSLTVTGAAPWEGRQSANSPVEFFGWWPITPYHRTSENSVPVEVLRVLNRDPRCLRGTPAPFSEYDDTAFGCVMFGSAEVAQGALDAAALLWAQKKAGLKP